MSQQPRIADREAKEVRGRLAAVLRIESRVPLRPARRVAAPLAQAGIRQSAVVATEMTMLMDVQTGWPLGGAGRSVYELETTRDGIRAFRVVQTTEVELERIP